MMELKPGSRWKSAVCNVEVVVVRPAQGIVILSCGGYPMVSVGQPASEAQEISPDYTGGTNVGKRYFDGETGVEVLGTKAGTGSLSIGDRKLQIKEAKPLPASD
jgi:hypothetical protein